MTKVLLKTFVQTQLDSEGDEVTSLYARLMQSEFFRRRGSNLFSRRIKILKRFGSLVNAEPNSVSIFGNAGPRVTTLVGRTENIKEDQGMIILFGVFSVLPPNVSSKVVDC